MEFQVELCLRQLYTATKTQFTHTHIHVCVCVAETIAREKERITFFLSLNRRNLDIFKKRFLVLRKRTSGKERLKIKERNLMKHDMKMIRGGEMKFTTQIKDLALHKKNTCTTKLDGGAVRI